MNDVDNTEEFRCISLCTGYAGIELGLRRIIPTLRTVVYVERETFACANLVAKMEAGLLDVAPIWTDIKTFDGRPFYKRVHIITGGYPCQGESVAGKRLLEKDPRWLWPYIARIVQAVKPLWCFFENVSGHLTGGYPTVYRSLRDMGYSVEAGLFTAAECGAPHKRERLFVLAHNNNGSSNSGDVAEPRKKAQSKFGNDGRSQLGYTQRTGQPSGVYGQGQEQFGGTGTRWPSRPGQPQYEWEEPRVVEHTNKRRLEGAGAKGQRRNNALCASGKNKGQAQPSVGMSANGNTCELGKTRIDELRLLGNGCVPAQVERAFRNLMGLFKDR